MNRCKENKEETCKSYPLCYGCNFFEKPTNYDRIRNMSVEKFAAQLLIKFDSEMGIYETDASVFNTYGEALKAKIKWLETEVSDE